MKYLLFGEIPLDVTESGEVTLLSGHIKSWQVDKKWGYVSAVFWINGKARKILQHRLVAQVFIDNPQELPEINHIDGNKQNNHYSNLEWVTSKQNKQHAIRTGLRPRISDALVALNKKRQKPLIYKNKRYSSVNECIRNGGSTVYQRMVKHPDDTYYIAI